MVLSGKTAVVTGGAAGIGQEIVHRLAAEGARVISMDWTETSEGSSGVCESIHGDVSSAADVKRVFDAAGRGPSVIKTPCIAVVRAYIEKFRTHEIVEDSPAEGAIES